VVVEQAAPDGAGAKAGLRAGDVLLRWETQGAGGRRRGTFADPFEVAEVEIDSPRGTPFVEGRRDGNDHTWVIPPGDWKLTIQPRSGDGRSRGPLNPAEAETLAANLEAQGAWRDACWLLLQAGASRAAEKQWPRAEAAFDKARGIARAAGSPMVEARAWEAQGAAALAARDLAKAEDANRQALAVRQRLAESGEDLGLAMAQVRLASVAFQRGDLATAEDMWTRALRIRQREAPDSLPAGNCLIGLGAIAIRRGDLEKAGDALRKALQTRERLAPGSLEHAQVLGNLGIVARQQGDLRAADAFHRRGLDIREKIAPEGVETAPALIYLGALSMYRGEWEAAEAYTRRALRIHEAHDPTSRYVTACLNNLGEVYQGRGQLAEAEAAYRRSLALSEKAHPDSPEVAAIQANLGDVILARGQTREARALLEKALALNRRRAPGGLELAHNLSALAELFRRQGQLARASGLEEEALTIRRRLAPGSAQEAESLYALGRLHRERGQAKAARARWMEAVSALESQRTRLARSEQGKAAFGARYGAVYTDLIELLVEGGETAEAFHLLERSRARSFLALLAARDLVFAADDVPADLLREQRRCDADYDQARDRLAAADAVRDASEVDKLLAQVEELRSRRERIAAAVRQASPRLGSLQQPEPLDVEGARAALDPGTLLLSWSVGRTRTLLFALAASGADAAPGGLQVFAVPVGEEALRRRITLFRGLVARGRGATDVDVALVEQGHRLFADLLGPARAAILASRRLLLVPDGPLHALPFAALVGDASSPPRYFGELRPLHTAASATVYAELKKWRARAARREGPVLVAFGEPMPDATLRLAPLPASRLEVEAAAAAYGRAAVTYVGEQATEDRAKALGPGPRFIHFASHGLLDERFPLDSALVLTPARPGNGAGNGLLQAWEVFERMRIDAELVTLSACESGLGREMRGEGLIGLSRAFQYAGASSVLASLWAVSDRSTAEWMRHFYAALARGIARDEAVQAAQAEMRRRPASAHPFHWAAFQLSGLP
jgi:tetratricopeptide (TPR) repeat protein